MKNYRKDPNVRAALNQVRADAHAFRKPKIYAPLTNFQQGDEVFENANYGIFNVSKATRMIMSRPKNYDVVKIPIDGGTISYIKTFIETDQKAIDSMTVRRMGEPGLAVWLSNDSQPLLLIDGHHRALKLWDNGIKEMLVVVIPTRIIERIRCQRIKVRGPTQPSPSDIPNISRAPRT